MEWFVYTNTTYYPWAEIVEADTAPEAVLKSEMSGEVLVFPANAVAFDPDGTMDEIRRDQQFD